MIHQLNRISNRSTNKDSNFDNGTILHYVNEAEMLGAYAQNAQGSIGVVLDEEKQTFGLYQSTADQAAAQCADYLADCLVDIPDFDEKHEVQLTLSGLMKVLEDSQLELIPRTLSTNPQKTHVSGSIVKVSDTPHGKVAAFAHIGKDTSIFHFTGSGHIVPKTIPEGVNNQIFNSLNSSGTGEVGQLGVIELQQGDRLVLSSGIGKKALTGIVEGQPSQVVSAVYNDPSLEEKGIIVISA